ncbi:MAG: CPBP family intramembrane metalloprotease [Candidatus Harrisonbacteria bacterium]|nr:CPBP family intramembrane metalloprotease [Candidatus Harrisonbacteria bacterium]
MPIWLELTLVFTAIESLIWTFDGLGLVKWLAATALLEIVIYSWHKRGDTWSSLGITSIDRKKDVLLLAFTFLILWGAVMLVAEIWNPGVFGTINLLNPIQHFFWYLIWAWFQQLCFNGYFVNRLQTVLKNKFCAMIAAGLLFGLIHLPNPVLVVVTIIGGIVSAYFYGRNRNLWYLAIGHAALAVTIHHFLPIAWHHQMRIGPGFYTWHP